MKWLKDGWASVNFGQILPEVTPILFFWRPATRQITVNQAGQMGRRRDFFAKLRDPLFPDLTCMVNRILGLLVCVRKWVEGFIAFHVKTSVPAGDFRSVIASLSSVPSQEPCPMRLVYAPNEIADGRHQ